MCHRSISNPAVVCCSAGERPFKCSQCDKAFNQKSALQVHMVKHTGKKPFKCEVCSISFTQKSNMKHHMKRSHGSGEHQHKHSNTSEPQWACLFVCLCLWSSVTQEQHSLEYHTASGSLFVWSVMFVSNMSFILLVSTKFRLCLCWTLKMFLESFRLCKT